MKTTAIIYNNAPPDQKIKNGTDLLTCRMTFSNLRPEQRENAVKNTSRVAHTHSKKGNRLAALRKAGKAPELACKEKSKGY